MVVSIERVGAIALVVLDNPPVNALGHALRQGIWDAADTLDKDPEISAVVMIATGRTFPAGADIREFGKPPQEPGLPDLVTRIEQATTPWIAAMHGTALGGGLELAMGCHYRVAASSAGLGLPEVTLGIIPGAGGTVRLPRLVPIDDAVEMVTTGKPVSARHAHEIGLVDHVVEGDLRDGALAYAATIASASCPVPVSARNPRSAPDTAYWEAQSRSVAKRARGVDAPVRALGCLRTTVEKDAQTAFALERETFKELRDSDQSRALRHVFFAERAATRPPEIAGQTPHTLTHIGVIGGGTMGAGIAAALRDADLPVTLIERDEEALDRARANLSRIYDGAVKRGRISAETRKARLGGVAFSTDYGSLSDADLVIEAVFEDLDVKREVFARLDTATHADAILATNTSYLDPGEIAAATSRPDRTLGLHFFSPANVMRLLEIVPAPATAPDVLATGFALAKRLGKIPVLAGICDGFIGNRILKVTRAQSERLLLSGSTPADVDRALQTFGMPMGPFAAQDLGGLDIAAFQRKAALDRGETPFAPVADRLCAMNRLGQKTGGGWYDYAQDDRTPAPSATVKGVIAEVSGAVAQEMLSDDDRVRRIVFPMINEGARILQEGIAKRPADIDLVEIHGYGFPRWRGGLMHYGETVGLTTIVEALAAMAKAGVADPPCEYLIAAAENGSFSA